MKVFAILSILPLLAFAVPTSVSQYPDVLHPDTHTVALDEVNKRMIAFDHAGARLGIYSANADLPRRRGSQCFPMHFDDINSIPKIDKLREFAENRWGGGKLNEVVNDEDYPERPMNICADDAGATVKYSGEPSCRKSVNKGKGRLEGGKVTLQSKQGISMSGTATVNRISKYTFGLKVSSKFSFPAIADVTGEISSSYEFSNEHGSSTTISEDLTTMQRIQQPVDEGQTCEIMLTTNTCSIVGTASLKMIATGFLWFQYERRRPPIDGPSWDTHYKWGVVIEKILPKDTDRATIVQFKTAGNIESDSHFSTNGCTVGKTLASGGGGGSD